MLGPLVQSAGPVTASLGEMRPSEACLGIREAKEVTHVVVLPRSAEDLRGEAPIGFGGETSGAQAGWRGAAHTAALRDGRGSKPVAGPPGQGWPRGHLRRQDSLPGRTFCRPERVLCLHRPVWPPPAPCGRGDTECPAVLTFNLFQTLSKADGFRAGQHSFGTSPGTKKVVEASPAPAWLLPLAPERPGLPPL